MHRTPLPPALGQDTSATSTELPSALRRKNGLCEREAGRPAARRLGENDPHLDRQTIPARRAGRPALRDQDQGGVHPWTRIFRMRLFIAGYMALTVTLFIMAAIG